MLSISTTMHPLSKSQLEERARAWAASPGTASAAELLDVCTLYADIPEDERDLWLPDTVTGCLWTIPASELATILTWYHTDPPKRELLNVLLEVYGSNGMYDRYNPTKSGPEGYVVEHWWGLSPEKQTVVVEHGKMDAGDVWETLYGRHLFRGHGALPKERVTWEFIDAFGALVNDHFGVAVE